MNKIIQNNKNDKNKQMTEIMVCNYFTIILNFQIKYMQKGFLSIFCQPQTFSLVVYIKSEGSDQMLIKVKCEDSISQCSYTVLTLDSRTKSKTTTEAHVPC